MQLYTAQFRPVHLDDPHDKVRVWQMLQHCGSETKKLFEPTPFFYSTDGVRWFFEDLNKWDARRFVTITPTDEVVGIGYYYVKRDDRITAYFGLLIEDKYQGHGIGSNFIIYMEYLARTEGASMMATGGGTALHGKLRPVLERLGYVNRGIYHQGTYYPLIMMEKSLTPT